MNDREFLRRARRYARRKRLSYEVDTERGKGSHWQFVLGPYKATIPSGEIRTGTLIGILKKLRIDREEF